MKKRSRQELEKMPKPENPAELEILSEWYFGKPLHLSKLNIHGPYKESEGSAQYEVAESYNSYHGKGWLYGEGCIDGYDYSRDFWRFVIGPLYCGGIAGRSYGQAIVNGHRNVKRLKKFSEYLRRKESGRLRKSFVRLAHKYGVGESARILDKGAQTVGREDGATAVSS